jgi:hypothetical protein
MKSTGLGFLLLVMATAPAAGWEIPRDSETLGRAAIEEILGGNDYPVTSTYTQKIEFIDFAANGQDFTQVVVTLTPDRPRLRNGKKLVVVGGEPGSEYGMDFVATVEGLDGPAVWLAKRGVTFVALTRVGRWNFLASTSDGSWESVPLGQRMPIFNRGQKAHWRQSDYEVRHSGVSGSSSASVSAIHRFPKKGTALERQMLAATPRVFIEGYRVALVKAIPDRQASTRSPGTTHPTAIWAGARARPDSPTSIAARSTAISTMCTNTARCAYANAASTTSPSTPGTSITTPVRDGGRRPRSLPASRAQRTRRCSSARRP